MILQVNKLNEIGCEEALLGLGFSFGLTANYKSFDEMPIDIQDKIYERAKQLSPLGLGHNKFIRQIYVCFDINAPRYWWSEFDTYKIGTVASSESTMHTLIKSLKNLDSDKEKWKYYISTHFEEDSVSYKQFQELRDCALKNDIVGVKRKLPEGFLQRRIWTANYAVLRNIVLQRSGHRLPHWSKFCQEIKDQINHPEFLGLS